MEGKSRPILVGIIGLLTILFAVFILVVGAISLLSAEWIFEEIGMEVEGFVGYGGFIIGIIILIIGIAIWRGWTVAWYIAVIIYILGLIGWLFIMFSLLTNDYATLGFASVLPILIIVLILYYLFRPKVKTFFGVGKGN